jgi:multiple sugar transport system permease protein
MKKTNMTNATRGTRKARENLTAADSPSLMSAKRAGVIVRMVVLTIMAGFVLFPVWWIIRSSLMTQAEVGMMNLIPSRWLFSNYRDTLQDFQFFLYLRNTLLIAVPAVIMGTSTAVMCGYAFARLRFRGKKFIFGLCIASMLLPPMVTLIPLYVAWTQGLGLMNTFWPLILPWMCGGGAFNIFLMRQFILTIPRELDEAAMIDGAGRVRILVEIIVPSIKPAIMVVAIFIFLTVWNDILQQTVYLSDPNLATMALGLRIFSGSYGTVWQLAMAAAVMSIVPGILIYIFGQKYLIEGIVMSGMKN